MSANINLTHNDIDKLIKKHFQKLYSNAVILIDQGIQNIDEFVNIYLEPEDKICNTFIYHRILAKREEKYNEHLTDEDIYFLRNSESFINYFKHFLSLKFKCDYYVKIENEIINKSRVIDKDFINGRPTISNEIRKHNSTFIKNLCNETDETYKLIENYLNYIEKNHNSYDFELFITM